VTEPEARRLAAVARVARLATVGEDGRPHVVPICFDLTGDVLSSAVDHKAKRTPALRRLDNVAANPAVEVVVDRYDDDWSALWWVRLVGTARVVTGGEEREAAVDRLAAKYPQYRERRPAGAVLLVDVERVVSWQAGAAP
jgi:PPOX class probable F420-dependent enzyme